MITQGVQSTGCGQPKHTMSFRHNVDKMQNVSHSRACFILLSWTVIKICNDAAEPNQTCPRTSEQRKPNPLLPVGCRIHPLTRLPMRRSTSRRRQHPNPKVGEERYERYRYPNEYKPRAKQKEHEIRRIKMRSANEARVSSRAPGTSALGCSCGCCTTEHSLACGEFRHCSLPIITCVWGYCQLKIPMITFLKICKERRMY